MCSATIVEVFVPLLDEGAFTARPVKAEKIMDEVYKILQTADYNTEAEVWQFLPGSVVRCKRYTDPVMGNVLLAYEIA